MESPVGDPQLAQPMLADIGRAFQDQLDLPRFGGRVAIEISLPVFVDDAPWAVTLPWIGSWVLLRILSTGNTKGRLTPKALEVLRFRRRTESRVRRPGPGARISRWSPLPSPSTAIDRLHGAS
jgi:hypothetical protein